MKFRLTYEGRLESNGSAKHKHEIRKALHPQLKRLWDVEPNLLGWTWTPPTTNGLPSATVPAWAGHSLSCVLVTGGKLVNGTIEGGTSRPIAKGDYALIPSNTPHWFTNPQGLALMTIHMPVPAK